MLWQVINGAGRIAMNQNARPLRRQPQYGTGVGAGCDSDQQPASTDALAQMEQGHRFCLSRDHADAEACFRAALALKPDWPMPHNNLGWALQAQGRNEEAVASYKKALQLAPALELAQANLAYLLANLYFFIGQFAQARSMWLFLANRYPEDAHVLDNLISMALRTNDFADAGQWAARHAAVTRGNAHDALPESPPKLTRGKLRHDQAQFQYLRDKGLLGQEFDGVTAFYSEAIMRLDEGHATAQEVIADAPEIRATYGRIVHQSPANRIPGHAVSFSEPSRQAEDVYLKSKLGNATTEA